MNIISGHLNKYISRKMATTAVVTKASIREQIKTRLKNMTNLEREKQSAAITNRVIKSEVYQKAKRVCVYLSMEDEVSTYPILNNIFASEKECFVPRYTADTMEMLKLHSMDDYLRLPETKWKIKQPATSEGRDEAMKSGGLDLMLVPGLGFTIHGHRLGRGKGYYDKYLQMCREKNTRSMVTIGLAFKEQLVNYIPFNQHDVSVDGVYFPNNPPIEIENTMITKPLNKDE